MELPEQNYAGFTTMNLAFLTTTVFFKNTQALYLH